MLQIGFVDAFVLIFLGQFSIGGSQGINSVLQSFQFLLSFVNFSAQLISLSLKFLSLLGGLDDIVGLGMFGLSIGRAI